MNTCIITGLKTNNKWKGQFIHRSVVDSAVRDYGCSTRDALIHIQETVRKNHKENMSGDEYMNMLEGVLGLREISVDNKETE